jgi:hypothetical protein
MRTKTRTYRYQALFIGIAGGSLGVALPVAAQQSETVVDISECVDLEGREQRECYEQRVQAVLQERSANGSADVQTGDQAARSSRNESPAPQQAAPTRSPPRAEPDRDVRDDATDEIVSTISSLREMEPNNWLIELENGQVWRQNRPKRYRLSEGDEVILRSTRWGVSYRLTDPDLGGFIQVERVR